MNHYIDIALRPDPEFVAAILLNALYGRFHAGLVASGIHSIGVSFPRATIKPRSMGNMMRLHGDKDQLERFMKQKWWGALGDQVECRGPLGIPESVAFYAVRRVQAKSSPERLRRRLVKRHGLSLNDAEKRIPDSVAKAVEYPFLQVRSSSTGCEFKLFIRQQPVTEARPGSFNYYGFSQTASVPWF